MNLRHLHRGAPAQQQHPMYSEPPPHHHDHPPGAPHPYASHGFESVWADGAAGGGYGSSEDMRPPPYGWRWPSASPWFETDVET